MLLKAYNSWNDMQRKNQLKALIYILDVMLSMTQESDGGKIRETCYMSFQEAFEIFLAFTKRGRIPAAKTDRALKSLFKDLILHSEHGLCVYIVRTKGQRYLCLRPDNANLSYFFDHLILDSEKGKTQIDPQMLKDLLGVMDSEWDKKILRYVLSSTRCYSEIQGLGFDPHNVKCLREEVEDFLKLVPNIEAEACENVKKNLKRASENCNELCRKKRRLINSKQHLWTEHQVQDKEEEVEEIAERGKNYEAVLNGADEVSFKRRVGYEKKKLIVSKRLKARRLGQGRKNMISEEAERYIAKCVEDKATAHGRRHTSVLYLNHRVKVRDMKKLLNKYHAERNLPLIKSATTLFNRGKAKCKRSVQAKKHIGLGLWCCKKAPKTDGKDNILTHFCRALKKNVIRKLCTGGNANVLFRSYDDKAYICPNTSTGMQSARSQKVVMSAEEGKGKSLTKYDFPVSMVNCTPGTFLYLNKEVTIDENGKESISTTSYDVVCQIKSKHFHGSSCSVWGSHLFDNRYSELPLHQVAYDVSTFSIDIQKCLVMLKDVFTFYTLQTNKEDTMMYSSEKERFVAYEREKLTFLMKWCGYALDQVSTEDRVAVDSVEHKVREVIEIVVAIGNIAVAVEDEVEAGSINAKELWVKQNNLIGLCNEAVELIATIDLPQMKSCVIDLCDAGPGVGITNEDVLYRVCTEFLICNTDYYNRIHLAPGDSSKNEVERIQSNVGDAVCDGGYLDFNYYPQFEGMSDEQLDRMSADDLEEYELKRMEKNALKVAAEVSSRIDGAPTIDGFMKSYVSKDIPDLFFWDTLFLKAYLKKSDEHRMEMPGCNFYNYLKKFSDQHARKGEKYLEVIRDGCLEEHGTRCTHCSCNKWVGDELKRIPEPYPNYGTPSYLHIDQTPIDDETGARRPVNDLNPRHHLKIEYEKGQLKEREQVKKFGEKYLVPEGLVNIALEDLKSKSVFKVARARDRKNKRDLETAKSYNDYDWKALIESGAIRKLVVKSLDKYIKHHQLKKLVNKNKSVKLEGIIFHFYNVVSQVPGEDSNNEMSDEDTEVGDDRADMNDSGDNSDEDMDDSSDEYDSDDDVVDDEDEDVVLRTTQPGELNASVDESAEHSNIWEDPSLFRKNRYGRYTGYCM